MNERGSGTILMVLVTSLVMLGLAGVVIVGGYAERQHHARAAADLAALSAAHTTDPDRCAVAAEAAHHNGATLIDCRVTGDDTEFVVAVQVEVPVATTVAGLPRAVSAQAHAGRVGESP